MNFAPTEIEQKSAQHAKNLLKQAVKNEPNITEDLQKIALEVAAEIVGLEHKFKTEDSLTKKLAKNSQKSLQYLSAKHNLKPQTIGKTVSRLAQQNNDALRYTFLLPIETYTFDFKQTLTKLKEMNYEIPIKDIWNAWKNIGTIFDKGYRGINVTIISSQGQIFELQFHTKESFRLKMKIHKLYKTAVLPKISAEKKEKIVRIMIELAKNISVPKGVKKL